MAQEIQKQLINPVAQGGAPFFADDLLRVQENAKKSTLNFYEGSKIGGFRFGLTTQNGTTYAGTPGLLLNIPNYNVIDDNGNVANVGVSSFFVYLDGEVCFYPGGTLEFKTLQSPLYDAYAVVKGQPMKESRVFRDGVSREIVVTQTVQLYRCSSNPSGWIYPNDIVGKDSVAITPFFNSDNINSSSWKYLHPNTIRTSLGGKEIIDLLQEHETKINENATEIDGLGVVEEIKFFSNDLVDADLVVNNGSDPLVLTRLSNGMVNVSGALFMGARNRTLQCLILNGSQIPSWAKPDRALYIPTVPFKNNADGSLLLGRIEITRNSGAMRLTWDSTLFPSNAESTGTISTDFSYRPNID